jgi:hypothetical protein
MDGDMSSGERKFLVFSDDTDECLTAAVFAGLRARAVGAGLVMLRCARVPGLGGWIGLDNDISRDAEDAARLVVMRHAQHVAERTGVRPDVLISLEDPLDAIRAAIDADPRIKVLILASGSGRWGPGPLVSRIGKGKPLASRPLAVTVIPGDLTDDQLDEIGGLT